MKKILIVGAGKSGLSVEKLLQGKAETFLWDDKMPEAEKPSVKDFDEVVMSPGIALTHPMALDAVKYGKKLSGELEVAYENCKGQFIAITGTNGKTTTTSLVGEIFKAAGLDTRVVGNIGLPVSDEALGASENTKMITEVSSFQLETVSDFHAHISAILNITPDHLNRHGSFENYARVKSIVTLNQTSNDYFIYNLEDPECVKIADELKQRESSPKLIGFSSKKNLPFEIKEIKIPGDHNIQNALAAAAICECAGIDKEIVIKTIASFGGVEHRMEFVRELDGVKYINDSKGTNPDSSIKAIEASGRGIILIAGGYEKNSDYTELIKSFNGKVEYILSLGVTGPRFAKRAAELGFAPSNIISCKDMKECVNKAREISRPGNTVLLSPASASWDMYKSFEERGNDFKELVNSL